MTQLFANNAGGTLSAGINSTATSIVLSSGQGALFPSPTSGDFFKLTLTQAAIETSWEIVCIVARTTDTLTVGVPGSASANVAGRGYDSTSAATWATSDKADHRITAADLTAAVPTGTMLDYAGAGTIPTGYLACDGSNYVSATYPALSAVLGTTWGAPGGGNFTVPDSRRRVSVGSGGTAVSGPANTVGSVGGEETHVQSTAEIAAHTHGVTDPTHSHTATSSDYGSKSPAPANNFRHSPAADASYTDTVNAASTGISVNSQGSSTAFNVMQPSYVVQKIIKT